MILSGKMDFNWRNYSRVIFHQPNFLSSKIELLSTRDFFFDKVLLINFLPLQMVRFYLFRRIHLWIQGKATFLALEHILHRNLGDHLEFHKDSDFLALHIVRRSDFANPKIKNVKKGFEDGFIPELQPGKEDYVEEAW